MAGNKKDKSKAGSNPNVYSPRQSWEDEKRGVAARPGAVDEWNAAKSGQSGGANRWDFERDDYDGFNKEEAMLEKGLLKVKPDHNLLWLGLALLLLVLLGGGVGLYLVLSQASTENVSTATTIPPKIVPTATLPSINLATAAAASTATAAARANLASQNLENLYNDAVKASGNPATQNEAILKFEQVYNSDSGYKDTKKRLLDLYLSYGTNLLNQATNDSALLAGRGYFEKGKALAPSDTRFPPLLDQSGFYRLGVLDYNEGKWKGAAGAFKSVYDLSHTFKNCAPLYYSSLMLYADQLYQGGNPTGATAKYQEAARISGVSTLLAQARLQDIQNQSTLTPIAKEALYNGPTINGTVGPR